MDTNSGYVGHSMSKNAAAAYEDGEMPKSRWTKATILSALRGYCEEFHLRYDPTIEKMTKAELFDSFLERTSWHHTSKFFNETDFYGLDERALCEAFPPMTDEEVAEFEARRDAEIRAENERSEQAAKELDEWRRRHDNFEREHGFRADCVAALVHEHPEVCGERLSRKGTRLILYIDSDGQERECPADLADRTTVYGFDATEPGSFVTAIQKALLRAAPEDSSRVYEGNHDTIKLSLASDIQKGKVTIMPEKIEQQNEKEGSFAHVKVPAAFVHPHTFTAKDGRTFEKAYVDIPKGTKVNGIDVGGYSFDVFMSDRMKQQMLSNEQPTVSLKEDEPVSIWTGKKDDLEHPYQRFEVNPWALVKGMKAEFDAFKDTKAAERAAEKEQGVSLKGEAEASREAADALSGHDMQDDRAQSR